MSRTTLAIPLLAVAGGWLLAACHGSHSTAAPASGSDQPAAGSGASALRPDGEPCLTAYDCASHVCEGQGCTDDQPGVCAPASRSCTKDLAEYCGCDGVTFHSSGSCPGQRFAARGRCPGE